MLGGGWDVLTIGQFPVTVNSVVLVIRFVVSPDESAREHFLSAIMRGPDAAQIIDLPNTKITPRPNSRHPERPSFMWFVMNLNELELKSPGEYTMQIFVDGEQLGEVSFDAVPQEADSTARSGE